VPDASVVYLASMASRRVNTFDLYEVGVLCVRGGGGGGLVGRRGGCPLRAHKYKFQVAEPAHRGVRCPPPRASAPTPVEQEFVSSVQNAAMQPDADGGGSSSSASNAFAASAGVVSGRGRGRGRGSDSGRGGRGRGRGGGGGAAGGVKRPAPGSQGAGGLEDVDLQARFLQAAKDLRVAGVLRGASRKAEFLDRAVFDLSWM
jgi:hypothetical protein